MSIRILRTVILLIAVVLSSSLYAIQPPNQPIPPPDPVGGGGGSCSYCSQTACGCAPAPPGSYLQFSCACGTESCSQSCDYYPLH